MTTIDRSLVNKVILNDTIERGPALASHLDALALSWKGAGNDNLNAMVSETDETNFLTGQKRTYQDSSSHPPALASVNGQLLIAWKGSGNPQLNVAQLVPSAFAGGTPVAFDLRRKLILPDSSDCGPALAAHAGALVLAWRGSGNSQLNTMVSLDGGATFLTGHKRTYRDSSDSGPALASHGGRLFIAWRGSGNVQLNVAELLPSALAGAEPVAFELENKRVLTDRSDMSPALASFGSLYFGWKGTGGNDQLNAMGSDDGGQTFSNPPKVTFTDSSDHGPALCVHHERLLIAWKGSGNEHVNVAEVRIGS